MLFLTKTGLEPRPSESEVEGSGPGEGLGRHANEGDRSGGRGPRLGIVGRACEVSIGERAVPELAPLGQ